MATTKTNKNAKTANVNLDKARKVLNSFTSRAAEALIAEFGLSVEQAKGFRNLISDGCRSGGRHNRGFYEDLGNGKGSETVITKTAFDAATATARSTLNALVTAMGKVDGVKGPYSYGAKAAKGDQPAVKGKTAWVDVPTKGMTAFDDATLDALMEAANAGGSTNAALAALDF